MEKYDVKESLRKVLITNEVPETYYSLGGYSEDAVCLEETTSGYIVYNGEKGNKHNKKEYQKEKVRVAAFDVISRLSESHEEERKMQSELVDIMINDFIDLGLI